MQIAGKGGVIVAGRAHADAEYSRVGQNQTPRTKLSVYLGKDEETQKGKYANVTAWRNLAEYASGIKKDDAVLVAGTLSEHEYNGKTYTELTADFIAYTGASAASGAVPGMMPPADFSDVQHEDDELPF